MMSQFPSLNKMATELRQEVGAPPERDELIMSRLTEKYGEETLRKVEGLLSQLSDEELVLTCWHDTDSLDEDPLLKVATKEFPPPRIIEIIDHMFHSMGE